MNFFQIPFHTLKILCVTLQEKPGNISKAGSKMHILPVCKYNGFSIEDLDLLFHSLIISTLVFGIEVWECASHTKYLIKIEKLFFFVKTFCVNMRERIPSQAICMFKNQGYLENERIYRQTQNT